MARPQVLPNTNVLLRWRDEEKLTQQQMADRVNEMNRKMPDYRPVTRAAISVALLRAGESGGQRPRYSEEIPWHPIKPEHYNDYRQTQLRTWARVNAGDENIPPKLLHDFELFKEKCEQSGAVIHYEPSKGFFAVKARAGIDTGLIRLTDEQIEERGLKKQSA